MNMLRRLLIYMMVLTLTVSTVACGGRPSGADSTRIPGAEQTQTQAPQNRLADGEYPIQQATYDDVSGEYTVMVLNTKPGDSSVYRADNLQMARLTDEDIAQGKKSALKLENGQASLYLTEDFKIEYVHNVTENVTNPQTGQTETVVVRQESSFWTPFAGALAGQALGSLLFRPQYYFPPVYQPGLMAGYGGYGPTYNQAVSSYQSRYNAPPNAVRNQQNFRTTGRLRTPDGQTRVTSNRNGDRSTGTGYGSNTLRRSDTNRTNTQRSRGFGSTRSRGFSRRR
jgi:hypothetical protein